MYFKIILLGESRVGKTTLRRSYMGENTQSSYAKTIGVDFSLKRTQKGGFQIWDIAGESTPTTIRSHLIGTHGIIFVFDVMNPETLDELSGWINTTTTALGSNLTVALVGNKIDLRKENTGLKSGDASEILKDLKSQISGNVAYFETSALTGNGVDKLFSWLLEHLRRNIYD